MASPLYHPAPPSRFLLAAVALSLSLVALPPLLAQNISSPALQSVSSPPLQSVSSPPLQSTSSSSAEFVASLDAATLPDAPLPQQTKLPKPDAQTPGQAQPSLGDLGLTPSQIKPNTDEQHRLDRRTHDLKVHQELGLYTTIPILAACISGAGAVPDRNNYGNTTSRDVHVAIASVAIGLYADTAYWAIRAPRIPGEGPARGGIKIHKYLIWIHAPGMILTPILGTMAFNDIASGHKPTGIAQYHQAVALTTAIAYGASIIAVSWPIHLHHFGAHS